MRKDAIKDLARSDILPEEAEEAGLYSVKDARSVYPEFVEGPAIVIPYYDPWTGDLFEFERDGELLPFCRVRYLDPPKQARGFKRMKAQRYGQPQDSGVWPYFPITEEFDWTEVLDDPDMPIVITEGEKKALRGCLSGVPTVGLGGVYNFTSAGEMLAPLDAAKWKKRPVYICYDSDAATNPDIQAAEARLAAELSLKRGAVVYLTRLPAGLDGSKQGIDDFIAAEGDDAFMAALESPKHTQRLRKLDSEVLSLNQHVAWIEEEGLVYDLGTSSFMQKNDFVIGSRYSALKVEVPKMAGTGTKAISVAKEWLVHPHAQRYQGVIFDPSTTERVVRDQNGHERLNMFQGISAEPGDVEPFLELTAHISKYLDASLKDFLIKLMAYKFQNPERKVPIAPVFIGTQGSGKSLWAKIIQTAAGQYGFSVSSGQLLSDFNNWVERAIIAVIDEAKGVHVVKAGDTLKNLISETRQNLNEKYRTARQVSSPTMYILTSNERSVGSFSEDDRRMFVMNVPAPREPEFYDWIGAWLEDGGARHVAHYLMTYPLKGWTPPKTAPMTAEKYAAYYEGLSYVQQVAEDMKTADEHVVYAWIESAMQWAEAVELANDSRMLMRAQEIRTSLSAIQIRPFYTADELALMFPHMIASLTGRMQNHPVGEISRQLREAGIRYLICKDDVRGFRWRGRMRQFLVVSDMDDVPEAISQNEFERLMKQFPTYHQMQAEKS